MAAYLVTGAAGFIGARVAEFLLKEGHTVDGADSLNGAYDVRLKEWRLGRLRAHAGFSFFHLDVTDRQALQALVPSRGRSDAAHDPPWAGVINLAARAGVRQSIADPWVYFETNVTGTLNLLTLCHEMGITKFVQASSSSLYGDGAPQPFREDADTDRPASPYAASKKAAEVLCHTYHGLYGIDVTVLRFFTVYGPAGRPDMSLFRFIQWIAEGRPVRVFGDGTQSRDFTYVDDIARGTIAGLKPVGFQIVNLGSDHPIGILEGIHLIERVVGRKANIEFAPRHPADIHATWAHIGKVEALLGWRPAVRFEDGIRRTVEWYQANRAWASEIET